MIILASIGMAILMGHALCLLVWARRFVRMFPPQPSADMEACPRATILLPVRGADPSLADCLNGLLQQNYPSYDVIIILDSREDPAFDLITTHLSASAVQNVRVHVLKEPRPTCSLKLSALLEAIAGLEDSCEIVALIDGDVIPHTGWLRDLAGPLSAPDVGATTGIRWYSPPALPLLGGWGTLVRYLWNSAAALHMTALHIPWGGSLAFRLDVLRRTDLLAKWSQSLFEDAGCYDSLRKLGLKVQVVPAATMVNYETIDLRGCFHFIRRQLLDARLYHSRWGTVLALALLSSTGLALSMALAILALTEGNVPLAGWLGGGLAVYSLSMMAFLSWIERKRSAADNENRRGPIWYRFKTLLALPMTQIVYFVCLVSACFLRQIKWRGITYRFDGPFSVQMIEYRPYASPGGKVEGTSVT
jgi:cellulose synthase/poly-beta-1,6-N-acetylglucosamine synthase-like glycosyltransferase